MGTRYGPNGGSIISKVLDKRPKRYSHLKIYLGDARSRDGRENWQIKFYPLIELKTCHDLKIIKLYYEPKGFVEIPKDKKVVEVLVFL